MADVVEKLRGFAAWMKEEGLCIGGGLYGLPGKEGWAASGHLLKPQTILEAADEIERLRKENDALEQHIAEMYYRYSRVGRDE